MAIQSLTLNERQELSKYLQPNWEKVYPALSAPLSQKGGGDRSWSRFALISLYRLAMLTVMGATLYFVVAPVVADAFVQTWQHYIPDTTVLVDAWNAGFGVQVVYQTMDLPSNPDVSAFAAAIQTVIVNFRNVLKSRTDSERANLAELSAQAIDMYKVTQIMSQWNVTTEFNLTEYQIIVRSALRPLAFIGGQQQKLFYDWLREASVLDLLWKMGTWLKWMTGFHLAMYPGYYARFIFNFIVRCFNTLGNIGATVLLIDVERSQNAIDFTPYINRLQPYINVVNGLLQDPTRTTDILNQALQGHFPADTPLIQEISSGDITPQQVLLKELPQAIATFINNNPDTPVSDFHFECPIPKAQFILFPIQDLNSAIPRIRIGLDSDQVTFWQIYYDTALGYLPQSQHEALKAIILTRYGPDKVDYKVLRALLHDPPEDDKIEPPPPSAPSSSRYSPPPAAASSSQYSPPPSAPSSSRYSPPPSAPSSSRYSPPPTPAVVAPPPSQYSPPSSPVPTKPTKRQKTEEEPVRRRQSERLRQRKG